MNEEKKNNRIWQAITHEWRYENLILVVLAIFAIELGVIVLTGENGVTIKEDVAIIGEHPELFAWILVGLGAASLILAVWGFYRPSFAEIKHLSGLKKKDFFSNILTVVVFSLILALLFVGFDALIEWFIKLF